MSQNSTSQVPVFALNSALEIDRYVQEYAHTRRAIISDNLAPETVDWLASRLRTRSDWRQVMNSGGRVLELDRAAQAALTDEQRTALDTACYAGARYGFQHRYEQSECPMTQRRARQAATL